MSEKMLEKISTIIAERSTEIMADEPHPADFNGLFGLMAESMLQAMAELVIAGDAMKKVIAKQQKKT